MTQGQKQAMQIILTAVERGMVEFDDGSEERECLSAWRDSLCAVLGERRLRVLPLDAQRLLASSSTGLAG